MIVFVRHGDGALVRAWETKRGHVRSEGKMAASGPCFTICDDLLEK